MSHFRGQKWLKARAQEREKEQREEELSGEVEDSFRAALPHSVISLLASQCHHPGDLYGGLEAYVNNKERPYVYLIKSESCYYLSFSECLIGHCNWQLTVITCWVVNAAAQLCSIYPQSDNRKDMEDS